MHIAKAPAQLPYFIIVKGNRAHVHCNIAKGLILPKDFTAQYRIWMMKRGRERGHSVTANGAT